MVSYEFDEESGIIKEKSTGERYIMVSKTRAEEIFGTLSQIFKSGIEVLLRESSQSVGEHVSDLIGEDAEVEINRLLDEYAQKFAQVGFGKIEFIEKKPEEFELRFRVWNNFFAEIGDGKSTYCGYIGGLFSGICKKIHKKVPSIKEVKCIANGDLYCEFHLKCE